MATPDMNVQGGRISSSTSTVRVSGTVDSDDTVACMNSAMNAASALGGSNSSFYSLRISSHADGRSEVTVTVPKEN